VKEYVPVPENEDDEVAISDEDMEYFADNQGFTSFLTGLDQKELSR
jgi:nucleolar complex protein 3